MTDTDFNNLIFALQQIAAPKITEWLTLIILVLNLFAACVIFWQFHISRRAFQQEHERARREKTIEVFIFWDQSLSRTSTLARKLVEEFTFAQAEQLLAADLVTNIDKTYKSKIVAIFPEIETQGHEGIENNGETLISLKPEFSGLLRWEIVSYLNNLETVLSAWTHHVCDREMIEEQFTYLVSPQKNHFLLKNFRQATGSSYPCIDKFIEHLKNVQNKPNPSKKKLGS